MAELIIPESVGGYSPREPRETPPVRNDSGLIIPESVGGPRELKLDPYAGLQSEKNLGQIIFESLTGAERTERLPEEFRDAPEASGLVGAARERGGVSAEAGLATGLLVSSTPEQRIDIIKNFIPDAEVITNPDGVTTIRVDGKPFVLNAPGFSAQDSLNMFGDFLKFLPGSKAASFIKGVTTRIVAATVGATGASVAADVAAGALGAEQGISLGRAGVAGLTEAVTRGVPAVRAGARNRRQAQRLMVQEEALEDAAGSIAEAADIEKAVGKKLLPAQKTADPFAIEEQSFLASHSAAARKASEVLKKQNADAHEAVVQLMNDIAPEEAVGGAVAATRKAAGKAVDATKARRSSLSSPIYKEAWKEGAHVETSGIISGIDDRMDNKFVAGPVHAKLKQVKTLIKKSAESGDDNLQALHGAKVSIGDILSSLEGAKASGTRNTAKRELTLIQKELTEAMGDASKTYNRARVAHREASPAVDAIEDSITNRIAKLKTVNLDSARSQAFKNPASVREVRKVVNAADPSGDTWRALVRDEVEERLKKVHVGAEDFVGITPDNAPAKIRTALFGNQTQREILLESLEDDAKNNAISLEKWLERASLGRPGGSQTGIRGVIEATLKGSSLAIRRFLKQPIISAIETGETAAYNSRVKVMGELYFNPDWTPQLIKVRKLQSNPKAQALAMAQVLERVLADITETTTEELAKEETQ